MKKSFLLVVLFAACAAQTQSLKMIGVRFAANGSTPNTIEFLCSQKYDHVDCVNDAIALRQAMAPYPMQTLGAWSFVLVTADEWKSLVRSQGGDSVSPAFSMLDQRVTLLDASLFSGSATRSKELMQGFGLMGPQLVDLAVTHEMGHGICLEKTSVVRTTMVRTPEWQHSRMQQDSGAEADQSGDKCPGPPAPPALQDRRGESAPAVSGRRQFENIVAGLYVPQMAKTTERTIALAGQGARKLTGNALPCFLRNSQLAATRTERRQLRS